MSVLASVSLGTVTDEAFGLFGRVPAEGDGFVLRGMDLVVSADIRPSIADYWILAVGTWRPGQFTALVQQPLQKGVKTSGLRLTFEGRPRVPRDCTLALRAFPYGSPAPLEGLSVALSYGLLGVR